MKMSTTGTIAGAVLIMACPEASETADETSNGTTSGSSPDACEVTQAAASEIDCGTYDDGSYACNGGSSSDGGDESGSSDGTGGDVDCEEMNEAVVSCITQAEAEGEGFTFGYFDRGSGTSVTTEYHVTSDGTLWRSSSVFDGLCVCNDTTVYEAIDLSECGDWGCIQSILDGAAEVVVCNVGHTCG